MNVAKVGKTGKGCGMADIEDCKYLRTEKDIDFFLNLIVPAIPCNCPVLPLPNEG